MANLEPVDKERCQAEKSNGENFMTLGGGHKMIRCDNKPIVIATEAKPGVDGKKGAMSLCAGCLTHFVIQAPTKGFAVFSNVDD